MAYGRIEYLALGQRVIVAAKEGHMNDWSAYIDAVPGYNHSMEYMAVLDHGSKLPEEIATLLFPGFKHLKWRN